MPIGFLITGQYGLRDWNIQWCEKNNCSFHTYNYWKHILKEGYAAAALSDIVPVLTSGSPLPAPAPSNEVSKIAQTISRDLRESLNSCHSGWVRITIDDTEISLSPSTSDEMICRIIQAVRYA